MAIEAISTCTTTSLEVPNVQELSKQIFSTVPSRYVHNDLPLSNLSILPEIPVIDMHKLDDPNLMNSELRKLHDACREWGFFQIINHGVEVERMKLEVQEFFNLPIEEKNKFRKQIGDAEGYGQAFVLSEDQKLDWADMFFAITLPEYLRKPHLIPKLPPTFRETIDAYGRQVNNVGHNLLNQMGKALGIELEGLIGEGMQSMRMNYYPACPQPHLVNGLSPHSDATVFITMLLQVNQTHGLEINKDGNWIPVAPLPNAFIVNIGDILEIVTNGIYRSIEHRVIVDLTKSRLSAATFLMPKWDDEIGPVRALLNPQNPAKFKTISFIDYFKGFLSKELNGKSYIDTMRI